MSEESVDENTNGPNEGADTIDDGPVEGCPDCRHDMVADGEDGQPFCTNCEWRP